MCGIGGIYNYAGGEPPTRQMIEAMCVRLAHRGPDGHRILMRGGVGLGHTRLSIIDLTSGWQPIPNEDKTIWVICNGEIYNYRHLRLELETSGHQFSTKSDSEVIVHLYEEFGVDFVKHLRGMFALALWDEKRRRLVLTRDRIGQKPLYYSDTGASIHFASEIKALTSDPRISKMTDSVAIDQYFTYGYIPAPRTIYENIKKLPPAHMMVCEADKIEIRRYWDLKFQPDNGVTPQEYAKEVRNQVREATAVRLESEVPLGFFLSGGVDSSVVVAAAAESSSATLRTFSIGFDEESYNELPYARLIASQFGTQHQELMVEGNIVEAFDDLIWFADEPFADSSMVPTYFLSKMARSHVTVALGGDGGDEVFAGYDRYLGLKIDALYHRVPSFIRQRVIRPIVYRMPETGRKRDLAARMARFVRSSDRDGRDERYASWLRIFQPEEKITAYSADFQNAVIPLSTTFDPVLAAFSQSDANGLVSEAQWVDTMSYLPGDLLVKADRMSMAHGLELRSPLLDHRLVEFLSSIPEDLKVRRFTTKYILKKAFSDVIPKEILSRPKEGFGVPLAGWLRNDLRELTEDLLMTRSASVTAVIRREYIDNIVHEHMDGRANHAAKIWTLLCLEAWCSAFKTRF